MGVAFCRWAWPSGFGGGASPLGALGEFDVDAFAVDVQGGVQGLEHLKQLGRFLGGGGGAHVGLRRGCNPGGSQGINRGWMGGYGNQKWGREGRKGTKRDHKGTKRGRGAQMGQRGDEWESMGLNGGTLGSLWRCYRDT